MNHHYHRNTDGLRKIGLFLAGAVTAIVAGGYYLYGPKGKERREKVEVWVNDAKREVRKQFDALKDVSKEKYYEIIDDVVEKYGQAKEVGEEKIENLKEELQRLWRFIEEESGEEKRNTKEQIQNARRKLAQKISPDEE